MRFSQKDSKWLYLQRKFSMKYDDIKNKYKKMIEIIRKSNTNEIPDKIKMMEKSWFLNFNLNDVCHEIEEKLKNEIY